MIAFAFIIEGVEHEIPMLSRLVENVRPHVDGIFVTITHKPGEQVDKNLLKLANALELNVSLWEWNYSFADARNYNFSQVPKEYEYILWGDSDDMFRGLEHLEEILRDKPDAVAMNYLYDFDDAKKPTVVHTKTMLVKNNGMFKWFGKLHEDMHNKTGAKVFFTPDIERLHLRDKGRVERSTNRNVEISKNELVELPNDPRSYWNYANSLSGAGRHEEAVDAFLRFIEMSQSEDEIYLARVRLGMNYENSGNLKLAEQNYQYALGIRPNFPEAYYNLAALKARMGKYTDAEFLYVQGLTKKPPVSKMIVHNPRDYDYNPLLALSKVYVALAKPDHAITCLKGCLKIYPDDNGLKLFVKELEKESKNYHKAIDFCKTWSEKLDKGAKLSSLKIAANKLSPDVRQYPLVWSFVNSHIIKEKSSGKDLVIYCGLSHAEWNPKTVKEKGVGGSEEAVYYLAQEWVKLGWNVTVYNTTTVECEENGVQYKPFWQYNYRDKQDITILWRNPTLAEYDINTTKLYVDLHDVIPPESFTEDRLAKIDKVFVKTHFHRSLFPNIPDEKICVIPNGMNCSLLSGVKDSEKDPYLLVNTSSPDRSMDVLPELFARVKKEVPEAKCKWAYGWDVFDEAHKHNEKMMEWKKETQRKCNEAGIEELGRVNEKDVAKLYREATVFAYPSEFAEIDCISLKKAQVARALPVVTEFGAFPESSKFSVLIKTDKNKDNWTKPYQFSYGIETEEQKQAWVEAVVAILKNPQRPSEEEVVKWSEKYYWSSVAKKWDNEFRD